MIAFLTLKNVYTYLLMIIYKTIKHYSGNFSKIWFSNATQDTEDLTRQFKSHMSFHITLNIPKPILPNYYMNS